MIKYTKSNVSIRPSYRTIKYGNLLSDTIQGIVDQGEDGSWSGWVLNWSDSRKSEFKINFKTKKGATRWVNMQLMSRGVK